ncbi:hypothetical protein THAR02_00128 [Trichoderma harzianum]|uniref:MYND-type domain-containing protein n=1 Tax=Trichoderma harzianum TaxID=5544 RepID=A0A0F9XTB2_TRIHA|nr:hypothetical protein THAR02_00128 [Trichoderma harzianum]
MLTPTVAYRYRWLYAIGNTPATNLARSIPHGQDASLLSLGCGDLRNVLYTSYVQQGLPKRKLDFTCCDIDENIIARNLVLLTMILANGEVINREAVWDIYYHMYLDEQTVERLVRHVKSIIPMLESLDSFTTSPFGSVIKIGDEDTLRDVRDSLQRILGAAEKDDGSKQAIKLSTSLGLSKGVIEEGSMILTGMRSAAPLALTSKFALPENFQHYWKTGVAMIQGKTARIPNPMLVGLLSDWELFHYGNDPLLSFHLATAFADLPANSPLKPRVDDEKHKVAAAARVQFFAWAQAFRNLRDSVCVRLVISDAFAFSHTLQYSDAADEASANWYRRLWDSKVLRLDKALYGRGGSAPTKFDAIDTSNLSDHFEVLNILLSTAPLLKATPWATLYTEQLLDNRKSGKQSLDQVLYGPSSTVSLLLGLTPLHAWTNAKAESHVDEIFISAMGKAGDTTQTQFHVRLAWKRDDQFGDYGMERPKLHMKAKDVSEILFQMYSEMFANEMDDGHHEPSGGRVLHSYPRFHRGSFTALLKVIQGRVKTDWDAVLSSLLKSIEDERNLPMTAKQALDFRLQLSLSALQTTNRIDDVVATIPRQGPLSGWKHLPPMIAVTLVVPRDAFARLFPQSSPTAPVPTLIGTLKSSGNDSKRRLDVFDDVHIVFGRVTTTGDIASGDAIVSIEEDELCWSGTSPLVATFLVPTVALVEEPVTSLVGLDLTTASSSTALMTMMLGMSSTVYEAALSDTTTVFVSKLMPGTTAHKVTSGGIKPLKDDIGKANSEGPMTLMAELPPNKKSIEYLTAHLQISSKMGKTLLQNKAPIELQQGDPFTINVVFGKKELIYPLRYPIPVTSIGSKTRIARTSGYIEVIAPLADPKQTKVLGDFISPTVIAPRGLPVAINMPHLNLDNLPIIDLKEKGRLSWLTTLTSLQFSVKERQLRDGVDTSGIAADVRVNFKESLFTMFMVSSGVQGSQTGLIFIKHPEKGGIQAVILVSALRLDGDTASVVLDAAIIPFSLKMLESDSLRTFLYELDPLGGCTMIVNDEELALWKKTIPSLVERCRTWNHVPSCEYKKDGATVPLSFEHGKQWLCSCGNGQLPDDFVGLPYWEKAAEYAVRIAISPMYSVPFVEPVINEKKLVVKDSPDETEQCNTCGKTEQLDGLKLKKCKGCMKISYCSTECQRQDWKQHKRECISA